MLGATSLIRHFIAQLEPGQMFSTRQVLKYGRRAAVDKALSRMVKDCELERLTGGLFVRRQFRDSHSLEEIVEAKAKAFRRRIWMHGSEAAHQLGLIDAVPESGARYFSTDGPSSSFQVGAVRVFLQHVSMRKVQYQDSPVGKVIAGFWFAGKGGSTAEMLASAIANFTRDQMMVLLEAIEVMPQWLTERISVKHSWRKPVDESVFETICSSADPYEEYDPSEFDPPEVAALEFAPEVAGTGSFPDPNSS